MEERFRLLTTLLKRHAPLALGLILAGNLIWTTVCLGGFRPETQLVTYSVTCCWAVLYLGLRAFGAIGTRSWGAADLLLGGFLLVALANVALIAPMPWLGVADWLTWANCICVYWIARDIAGEGKVRALLFGTLVALAILSVLFGAYQCFVNPKWLSLGRTQADQFWGRASGFFGIPNSLAALILLVLPSVTVMPFRPRRSVVWRVFWGYLAVLLVIGIFLTISRGAWISLGLVLVAVPLWATRVSFGRRMLLSGCVVFAGALLFVTVYKLAPDSRERLEKMVRDAGERTRPIMWRGAWELFKTQPVFGTGAGSYNLSFEKYRPEGYPDEPLWAHNEYLNTLSDYGAVGFILFFGAIGMIGLSARPAPHSTPLALGLAAFLLQLAVDFHLKIPALGMAFALCAALWVQVEKEPRKPPVVSRVGCFSKFMFGGGGLVLASFFVLWALPITRAEALRYSSRQAIDRLALVEHSTVERALILRKAEERLCKAVELAGSHGGVWADLSFVYAQQGRDHPEQMRIYGEKAERAARKSLLVSKSVPEAWVRLGVSLDMQGRWIEGGQGFVEATKLAPNSVTIRYYMAYHFAQKRITLENARGLVDSCLRIDPGHVPSKALRALLEKPVR